jgi:DNA-directed RNA polymerase specialized sigma24 family protein
MNGPDPIPSLIEDADESPVTTWVRRLEAGDAQAAQSIWDHFFSRMLCLARRRMPPAVRPGYDEDDVALSAFHSLFVGITKQRFDLKDRDDLWRLLLIIAERKISRRVRREYRDKRDVRRALHESMFVDISSERESPLGLDTYIRSEPTPDFAAEVAESCDRLFDKLPDESLKRVALMKLENYTAEEIAKSLGCTRKTVQRKLFIIRKTWQDDFDMADRNL